MMTLTGSALYIPLCLLAGAAYATLLYYSNKRHLFSAPIRWTAAIARFVVVSVLSFLLLAPMVKTEKLNEEKPVLVLAMDNSESMLNSPDSAKLKSAIPQAVVQLAEKLNETYTIQLVSFGHDVTNGLSTNFDEDITDYSSLFGEMNNRLVNNRQSTVVVFSDGLVNRGSDPLFATIHAPYRIFTVACGDSTPRDDVFIKSVKTNKVGFTKSELPIEVVVNAEGLAGKRCQLKVTLDGEPTQTKALTITNNHFSLSSLLRFTPDKAGLKKITAEVTPIDREYSPSNNKMVTYVEVMESRRKILLLGAAPHPDLGAIRQIIETEYQFEVDLQLASNTLPAPSDYNLVVFHQLPSTRFPLTSFFNQLDKEGIPSFFIIGTLTSLEAYNNLLPPVTVMGSSGSVNANAQLNPLFSLFQTDPQTDGMLRNLPPLVVPFGEYRTSQAAEVLMNQTINGIATNRPLVVLGNRETARCGVMAGEGIWLQYLTLKMLESNASMYETLILKTLNYLSIRKPKERFSVETEKTIQQYDQALFEATLLNESFETVTNAEVTMDLTDEGQKNYPFKFTKQKSSYMLNAGRLAPGKYQYTATALTEKERHTATGQLVVLPTNLEQQNQTADNNLLRRLATERGGSMLPLTETSLLAQLLSEGNQAKPVVYTQETISDLITLPLVFFLILILAAGEWILRRWGGSY